MWGFKIRMKTDSMLCPYIENGAPQKLFMFAAETATLQHAW
jgi:hypothetical protein